MEIGQMCFGNPTGEYAVDDFADALIMALLKEIGRVEWNKQQKEWRYEATDIPGLTTNPYYWGDDEAEAAAPNLAYAGTEIRWYKYPGRGMTVNKKMTPAEWSDWFYSVLTAVRKYEADLAEGK